MDPVGNRLDTAGQGLDSHLALGPSHQGGTRSTVVVPLVVQLGALAWGVRHEQVALGMVQGVLAGSVA